MSVSDLPTLNAILNSLSAAFLLLGFMFIRQKKIPQHRAMMLAAFTTSALFLIGYLTYHFNVQLLTRFQGTGIVRVLYFSILISHSVLAVAVPPLAIITLFRGLKMKVEKHRRIARWTLPIWLYTSVTGVLVYLMLYHFYA
jgi:putative membrane protein